MIMEWQEISRKDEYKSPFGHIYQKVVFKLPDGREDDFYIKNEKMTICVLALTKSQEVILARQYRPGPKEIINELPGGGIDGQESPEIAATRELLEETGYQGKMQLVAVANDCGYSTRKRYCFVATECEKVSDQRLDKNEWAEVRLMPLTEFRKYLRTAKMTDTEVAYLGLDFLGLL